METILVFSFDYIYPDGGLNDLIISLSTLEELDKIDEKSKYRLDSDCFQFYGVLTGNLWSFTLEELKGRGEGNILDNLKSIIIDFYYKCIDNINER